MHNIVEGMFMKKNFYLALVMSISFSCLSGCSPSTVNSKNNTENVEQQTTINEKDTTEVKSSETEISQSAQSEEKDYSIPKEFIDYKKFIGEDISVLNVDTSDWDTNDFSHDLWRGSFYGHNGNISVSLGWDNKTIVEFFLQLDDTDKLSESDREELNSSLQDTFGSDVEEMNISYNYSGKDEYEFQFPKLLDQTSVCTLSWNTDTMLVYMNTKPKAEESATEKPQIVKKDNPTIGMTPDEVKNSTWGEPSDINKTTTKYGISEQWVYRSSVKNKYIYFENGLVTAIQE